MTELTQEERELLATEVMEWEIREDDSGEYSWYRDPKEKRPYAFKFWRTGFNEGHWKPDLNTEQAVELILAYGKGWNIEVVPERNFCSVSNHNIDGIPSDGWTWEEDLIYEKQAANKLPLAITRAVLAVIEKGKQNE